MSGRTRVKSLPLPVVLALAALAAILIPARAAAQCPAASSEGATPGITQFNTVKAQAWFNDGEWWGAFSDNFDGIFIYRFPAGGGAVRGSIIDSNVNGIPDALWDGSNLFIAVWKSVSLATLYKYTYSPATKTYALVSGFPVQLPLNGSSTSALVIAKDSTGKLWGVYTGTQGGFSDGAVRVIWSTSADHRTWNTTGLALETGLTPNVQEIATVIPFGGNKVGVAWSNQTAREIAFRYHADGQAETEWSAREVIDSGLGPRGLGGVADDHLAMKEAPDGRIFLVAKDNDNDGAINPAHANEGRIWLYVRTAAGFWDHTVKVNIQPDYGQLPTRPVLLLDTSGREVYVVYHDQTPGSSQRDFIAHASMDTLAFDFPCVLFTTPANNPTSTKQNVDHSTGFLVASSTGATGSGEVIFKRVLLSAPNATPAINLSGGLNPSSRDAGGADFTLEVNGTGFVEGLSVVRWNGEERVTTFVSATKLTAQIFASDIAAAGTASVTVYNPPPGGGTSNAVTFTVNAAGLEGDLNGNGAVSVSDWVKCGRYAAGLDAIPAADFQKADTAPRSSLGNGTVSVSDWVQCGRYAAGLDPLTPAGGPGAPSAVTTTTTSKVKR